MWVPRSRAERGQAVRHSPHCGLKGWPKAWCGVRGEDFGEGKGSFTAPREKNTFLIKFEKAIETSCHVPSQKQEELNEISCEVPLYHPKQVYSFMS